MSLVDHARFELRKQKGCPQFKERTDGKADPR